MRKIFALLVCAFLICTMPVVAFAEDITEPVETEEQVTETEEVTEEVTEAEEVEETEAVTEEVAEFTSDTIVAWIEENFEEISVIVSLVVMLVFQVAKHTALNKSVALCNNNAVAIVENSNDAIKDALDKVNGVADVVESYKSEIVSLLAEIRRSDDEKKRLETALAEVESLMKTAKLANVELANEVAELLVLANIPNSKKEELYARHRAAVVAIEAADNKTTEVMDNVGENS